MILGAVLLFLQLLSPFIAARNPPSLSAAVSEFLDDNVAGGTRWALLVAGSRGYVNYRHQADVCHAYQILKRGGLKDENIIVFMYDDIAFNKKNPRRGVIINSPAGVDVYKGVPKDYTRKHANLQNLYSVMLGNTSGLTGGSRKVLRGGPKDRIFIYYVDHGSPGIVSTASDELIFANELNNVLKRMHQANAYATMVFYLEACESGSMFEGLLPNDVNIYAVTASNAKEDSYAAYCPPFPSTSLKKYDVCLGDTFSVAWMEDSDKHYMKYETLGQQYQVVKQRTETDPSPSHVMQYGNVAWMSKESVSTYMGGATMPTKALSVDTNNYTWVEQSAVAQRDAMLLHYHHQINTAPKGSNRRLEAEQQLLNEMNNRMVVDNKMKQISNFLFRGAEEATVMTHAVRPAGMPLVDDWSCLKTFVRIYEEHCGGLSKYGMKYTRSFANMCNAGITPQQMNMAATNVCN